MNPEFPKVGQEVTLTFRDGDYCKDAKATYNYLKLQKEMGYPIPFIALSPTRDMAISIDDVQLLRDETRYKVQVKGTFISWDNTNTTQLR